jgi:phage I-like protein
MLIRLAFALPAGDTPPTEFRLFRKGDNATEKGTFLFDDKAATLVMERYQKRGTRCFLDYNHASLDQKPVDPKESAKSAGWFDLEVRDGELWATNINWTPPALVAFNNKEFAYFSPAFSTDKTKRIVDFVNCALTNLPASHDIPQLVAADRRTNLSVAFSAIHEAVDAALREAYEEDGDGDSPRACPWIRDLFDDVVVFDMNGQLRRQAYKFDEKTNTAKLTGKAEDVRVDYVPLARIGNTVQSGGQGTALSIAPPGEITTLNAPPGAGESTMADMEEMKKTLEDLKAKCKKLEEDNGKLEEETKKLKMAPPFKKKGEDEDEEAKKASRIVAAARTATGKSDPSDIEGALILLSTAHERNRELVGKLEAVEVVQLTARVDEAIKAGKVLPSKRQVMLDAGTKALDTYLDMLGDVRVGPPVGEHKPDPNHKAPETTTETPITLDASERAQMAALGISEKRMVQLKRDTVAGKTIGATFTLPGVADAQPIIE